jgi:hypothetical protein
MCDTNPLTGKPETSCEVCGRRSSWGCGHEDSHIAAFRLHVISDEHVNGDCECFVSRAGYMAFYSPEQVKSGEHDVSAHERHNAKLYGWDFDVARETGKIPCTGCDGDGIDTFEECSCFLCEGDGELSAIHA